MQTSQDASLQIPSNSEIRSKLQEGERLIQDFKESERGQDLNIAGQVLLDDSKRLLKDGEEALKSVNEGEKLQHIADNGWGIIRDVTSDLDVQELFFNWHSIVGNIAAGGDITELLKSCGEFLLSIRDSQKFIELLAELVRMLKLFVAEKTEKVASFGTDQFREAGKQEHEEREQAKEKAVEDLRAMIKQLSENETWTRIVKSSQKIADKVTSAADQLASVTQEYAGDFASKELERFESIVEDLQTLLQRAVGDEVDIDKLFEYTKRAVKDISNDERLPGLFSDIQSLLIKCADNPSEIDAEATVQQFKDYYARLQEITNDLKDNFNVRHAKRESKKLLDALKAKSTDNKLVADVQKLLFDVKSNKPGELIDPQILGSLRHMIVPMLIDHMSNLPLPSIEDTFEFLGTYNYKLEDVSIELPGLIPEDIHISLDYDLDANVRNLELNNQRVFVKILAKNIQIHMKDISWSYERQSTPKLTDSGKLSLDTGKRGLALRIILEAMQDPTKTVIEVLDVRAVASDWNVTFKDSKHDVLYKILANMFSDSIKKEVRKKIEERLRGLGKAVNDKLVLTLWEAHKQARQLAHDAKAKTQELAEQAKDTAIDLSKKTTDAASEASDLLKTDLQAKTLELAKDLIMSGKIDSETLQNAASDLAQKAGEAGEKIQEVAGSAGQKISEVAKDGSEKLASSVGNAGEKGADLALKAGEKIEPLAKEAGEKLASGARQAGDKIGEKAKPASENIADKAERAGDSIAEGAKKAGNTIGSNAREAGDKVAEGAKKAGDKAAEGAKAAGDKSQKAGDKAAEKAEQAGDKASEGAKKAGDKAQQAGDKVAEGAKKAGDKVSEKAEKAGDKAEKAGDKAAEGAKKAGDKVAEGAQKTGDKAKRAGDKAAEKAEEAGDKAAKKAKQAGDKIAETAPQAGEKVAEKAHEAGHKAADSARQAGDKIAERAPEFGEKVAQKAESAGTSLGEGAKDASEKAADLSQQAGQKGSELIAEAGQTIARGAEKAGDAIANADLHAISEDARDKVRAAGDKAQSGLQTVEDRLREKADEKGSRTYADAAQAKSTQSK